MSEPSRTRTKQEMFSRMETGLEQFLSVLDSLTDQQMLEPMDAVGWNVRDHITHLAAWAEGIAALIQREDRWSAMGLVMDDPEGDEPDYEAINQQIVVQHRHLSPAEARAWLISAHERVRNALDSLAEEDLSAPYERFVAPFTGSGGHPISEYILGNTEDHYDEHTPWILSILSTG